MPDKPIRVTMKQARLAEAIVNGEVMTASDAARIAGYAAQTPHVASVSGAQALAAIGTQHAIQQRRLSLAEQAGISPEKVLARIESRAEGGESGEVPHSVRQRADETLIDILALRDQGPVVDARSLNLSVSSEDVKALARLIAGDD